MSSPERAEIDVFASALAGARCRLELVTGELIPLPIGRWHRTPSTSDDLLLSRCTGPTLDVGCGPGRLAAALTQRGLISLGIDSSPIAVGLTVRRGGVALHRDVFRRLPGEGRWRHVLLADGNIGIGGDPAALLRRVGQLLAPAGSALIEAEPADTGLRREMVRVYTGRTHGGGWFPWAWMGCDAVGQVAADAGFEVVWTASTGSRWFAELRRPPRAS